MTRTPLASPEFSKEELEILYQALAVAQVRVVDASKLVALLEKVRVMKEPAHEQG